ncbi:MAG TPA: epoxide hydrolase [Acidothermales bacterium]
MNDVVRPFRIAVPEQDLVDLRTRLRNGRWPEEQPVLGWAQGVPLRYLRELCDFWADGYEWRTTERRLNAISQMVTTIDGLDVHALHVRSPHAQALPLVLTHGWPGSFLEFEAVVDPLIDPVAYGGQADEAVHLVVPSLPGYGFSGKPSTPGWGVHQIARAWVELMSRLGYDRFIAAGSDWGTSVSTCIALDHPERLLGLHLVPPLVGPPDGDLSNLTAAEEQAVADLDERTSTGSAYSAIHATRPQTLGYGLVDSPIGLCAWLVEKIWTWADHDGDLNAVIARQRLLDNVTLYWLTRTGASSIRLYWQSIAEVSRWFTAPAHDVIDVPTACSVFTKEVPRPSRRWAERRFTNIVHWGEPPRGGHFAAWEQPQSFVIESRAAVRACRK